MRTTPLPHHALLYQRCKELIIATNGRSVSDNEQALEAWGSNPRSFTIDSSSIPKTPGCHIILDSGGREWIVEVLSTGRVTFRESPPAPIRFTLDTPWGFR